MKLIREFTSFSNFVSLELIKSGDNRLFAVLPIFITCLIAQSSSCGVMAHQYFYPPSCCYYLIITTYVTLSV